MAKKIDYDDDKDEFEGFGAFKFPDLPISSTAMFEPMIFRSMPGNFLEFVLICG